MKFLSAPEQTLAQGSGPRTTPGVDTILISACELASRNNTKIGTRSVMSIGLIDLQCCWLLRTVKRIYKDIQ